MPAMIDHKDMPRSVEDLQNPTHLSGVDLKTRLAGKCFLGLYLPPFQFVTQIHADGRVWGRNNYGTQDQGRWSIDLATDEYTLAWQGGWENTVTVGYDVAAVIHLFDVQTGGWRNALLREIDQNEMMF